MHAASTAPARAWGLDGPDGPDGVGAIEPGSRADLVVLADELEVVQVMRAGA